MFAGVSTNGSSIIQVQLGDAGGVENTGYASTATSVSGAVITASSTTGYIISGNNTGTFVHSGAVVLSNMGGELWVLSGSISQSTSQASYAGGSKTLSATLDRVRITTVNGTDTFDAGTINILYEG
jgi:hypothetical protein